MNSRVVLVVEDNALTRKMVRISLEKGGYDVFEAGDGATAITMLEQHEPALVLQDLHLPDMDGVTLVRRLRSMPAGEAVPIFAFSGLMSKMEEARTLGAGFTDYIFKPVEPTRLVSLVDSYLAVHRAMGKRPDPGHRILLVDDDPIQGKLNARQLRDRGFVVELAGDGPAALDAARKNPPDAIILDLLMPGMTGMEVCLAIRRDSLLARTPVIITSSTFAVIEDADRRLAETIGADAFVARTPAFAEVIAAVTGLVDHPSPHAPAAGADAMSTAFSARLMRQLEHQASLNAGLVRQTAMHTALLSIMSGAADILTREHDLETVLQTVLARALDAGGVSAGAIYLLEGAGRPILSAQAGFPDTSRAAVESFFGEIDLLATLARGDRAVEIPSPAVDERAAREVLERANTTAIVVAPLLTAGVSHGALVLRASSHELGEGFLASISAVAAQLGQAVALSRTVARLTASEARYRSLFEGIPTGVFRSAPDGTLLDLNDELVRLVGGETRESLIGTSAIGFYLRPEDRAAWMEALSTDGEVRDFETPVRKAEGAARWVALSARAVRSDDSTLLYYEGTITDITRRKEAEEELHAAQARLEHVVTSSDVVFYLLRLRPDGMEPEWVSDNIRRVTGHEGHDVMQFKWWFDNVHPDDRDRILAATRSLSRSEQWTLEYRFRRADGRYMWLRDSQRRLANSTGGPDSVVGALLDITEQKSLEAQLVQAQKMEAIGQLAAGVAHDFNNILTVIAGFAEMLGEDLPTDDPGRVNVSEIVLAAKRAGVLTRQLLAFGRRQVLQPIVLDLNKAVGDAGTMLGRLIGEHITVRSHLAPGSLSVQLDPGQLEQVILNLAVNARDAMPRGGTFTIETRGVHLSAAEAAARALPQPGGFAMLVVHDTGVGMDREVQARIFEPFFTTKERGKGTGLGLSTAYGIVKQSGGNILVESEPGAGTTFRIYFPLSAESESIPVVAASPEPAPAHGEVILLVEDEDSVRRFANHVLADHGYVVLNARNAADALRCSAEHPGVIDVLLSDVIMPGMNGPELSQQIVAQRPGIAVVFMSGYLGDATVQSGGLPSGTTLLAKPFAANRLLEVIGMLLADRSA